MAANDGEPDVLKNARSLMLPEVVVLLENYISGQQKREPDWHQSSMLMKTAEYARRFTAINNRDTMQRMRELLASKGLTEKELATVTNLMVESADEARKLVPALDDEERFPGDQLDLLLQEVKTLREFE